MAQANELELVGMTAFGTKMRVKPKTNEGGFWTEIGCGAYSPFFAAVDSRVLPAIEKHRGGCARIPELQPQNYILLNSRLDNLTRGP